MLVNRSATIEIKDAILNLLQTIDFDLSQLEMTYWSKRIRAQMKPDPQFVYYNVANAFTNMEVALPYTSDQYLCHKELRNVLFQVHNIRSFVDIGEGNGNCAILAAGMRKSVVVFRYEQLYISAIRETCLLNQYIRMKVHKMNSENSVERRSYNMMRQISLLPEVDLLSIDVAVVPFEVLTSLLQMLRKKPRVLILKNARNTDTEISALRDYEQHCFNEIQPCPSHTFIYLVNINRFHESTSFPKL